MSFHETYFKQLGQSHFSTIFLSMTFETVPENRGERDIIRKGKSLQVCYTVSQCAERHRWVRNQDGTQGSLLYETPMLLYYKQNIILQKQIAFFMDRYLFCRIWLWKNKTGSDKTASLHKVSSSHCWVCGCSDELWTFTDSQHGMWVLIVIIWIIYEEISKLMFISLHYLSSVPSLICTSFLLITDSVTFLASILLQCIWLVAKSCTRCSDNQNCQPSVSELWRISLLIYFLSISGRFTFRLLQYDFRLHS